MNYIAREAQSLYRRMLIDTCELRRTNTSARDIRCRISGYGPSEVGGSIMEGDQRLILLAEDLARFDVPPRKGDKAITADGRTLTVVFCDGNTRKIGDTVIAYEIQARGA